MERREDAHGHVRSEGGLLRAFLLSLVVMAVEVVGGFFGHSFALFSDAGHQAADGFSAALALVAEGKAKDQPTARQSYGFHRAGILAAAVNGLLLVTISGFLIWQALRRLTHPVGVNPSWMAGAAIFGLLLNAWAAWGLKDAHQDLNRRAVLIHFVGDAASSLAVLLAAGIIALTGWMALDPLLSAAIALVILISGFRILAQAAGVLMEAVPAHLDPAEVEKALLAEDGVLAVHDLHIWALGSERTVLTCHLFVREMPVSESQTLVEELARGLRERFGIGHATLQTESREACSLADGCVVDERPAPMTTGAPEGPRV